MLLEVTLMKKDPEFGNPGEKVMVSETYIVGVAKQPQGSKIFIDMSDLNKFKTLYIRENYENWYTLKLNP